MIKISFQRKCFLHPFIESNYFPCFKHEHLTLFIDIIEDYVFGEKYKIVPPGNARITWEQARKNCQTMGHGWDLLKIQSRAEDLIIREMLKCELRGNIKSTYDNFYYQRFCFVNLPWKWLLVLPNWNDFFLTSLLINIIYFIITTIDFFAKEFGMVKYLPPNFNQFLKSIK